MLKQNIPLKALRAFEASAQHLRFTRAGLELRVAQTAISHQVKGASGTCLIMPNGNVNGCLVSGALSSKQNG
jgi:hypothetical protein